MAEVRKHQQFLYKNTQQNRVKKCDVKKLPKFSQFLQTGEEI